MTDPAPFLLRMPWPAGTPITQEFGEITNPYPHRGRDGGCPTGTPIKACAAGFVVPCTNDGSFGAAVCIDYRNGLFGLMAHNSAIQVSIGDQVRPETTIALSGYSGFVQPAGPAGAHSHFQLCVNTQFPTDISYSRDPRLFLITEDSPMTPAELTRLERTERLLAGNGYIATPRPDAGNARYSQIFAEELALQGGKLTEYRGSPPVAGGKVSAITVSAEGADGPAYMLTGERALKYADWRGFSLGLALEYKSNAS